MSNRKIENEGGELDYEGRIDKEFMIEREDKGKGQVETEGCQEETRQTTRNYSPRWEYEVRAGMGGDVSMVIDTADGGEVAKIRESWTERTSAEEERRRE